MPTRKPAAACAAEPSAATAPAFAAHAQRLHAGKNTRAIWI